jgi:protein-serine/threonine kinase
MSHNSIQQQQIMGFPASNPNSTTTTNAKNSTKPADISNIKKRIPREIRFGNYVLGSTVGEGEFGKVKLGWRKDGKLPSQAAIKLIKRDSIPTGSEKEGKIYREITALKRLRHPNIVRLVEVLQNDKYIGIVLEYASGGELFDYILDHRFLKESLACRLFAQLVSGVDYMHSKGIVHRDLKLENLLLDKHKNIIITDFGFVNSFQNSNNDLMKTSCGSPCYAAPELVVSSEPYEGKKVDIWSCGVILYAMLAGYLPFDDDPENPDGTNIAKLYHYITHTPLTFPEYIQPTPRDLLRRILVANPNKRINLKDIKNHRWLSPHSTFLNVTPIEWDRNYRSSRIINTQDKSNRRMSLMENPTSASLMLNKQNVRSYSTQNVQAALYSNPAAPQTSRTVAIPSAETSPVASPVRQPIKSSVNTSSHNLIDSTTSNNTNNNNSNSNNNNNNNNNDTNQSRHSRSGSTASLVLQAVVDADVENKRRYSNGSSDILTTPVRNSNPRPISFAPISSDNKNFETINESPEHNKMLPPPIPVFRKPANLPTRSNKPRPTSYHPSNSSNNLSPIDSYTANSNYSESSFRVTSRQRAGNNSSNYSLTSESLISTSLKESVIPESENSRDEVEVTTASTNATLTTSTTTTKDLNENISNTRNSYAMDLLTNAFDTFSMISKSVTPTIEKNDGPINIYNESSSTNNITKENENTVLEAKNLTNIAIEESEKENLTHEKIELIKTRNNLINQSQGQQPKISNSNLNSATGAAATKYKRFSLLTFYQNIPEATSPSNYVSYTANPKPVVNLTSENNVTDPSQFQPAPEITKSIEPKDNIETQTIKSQTKQRIVTPNSIKSNSSISGRSTKNQSTIKSERRVSSINAHDNKNNNKSEKETSTARKVMDFFKRRSMRI